MPGSVRHAVTCVAIRVEAIATREEAIASRLEATAIRLEAIATRVEAIQVGYMILHAPLKFRLIGGWQKTWRGLKTTGHLSIKLGCSQSCHRL